jgi:DNA-directed RNA polymerase subunit beta'
LVEGQSIQLHPLVCEAFNADFDGDQMAVHVPLSSFAQAEARIQMLSAHNLLSPASGEPLAKPSRDIILGLYYITQVRREKKGAGMAFATPEEALKAHERGEVALNAPIVVAGRETSVGRLKFVFANPDEALLAVAQGLLDLQDVVTVRYLGRRLETSPGRILFARIVGEAVGDEGVAQELIQMDVPQEKNSLKDLVYQAFLRLGMEKTARLLDALKYYGFTLSTTSGITIGIDDAVIPEEKQRYLEEADRKLRQIEQAYEMGFLTDRERYDQVIQLWTETTEKVTQAVFRNFEENYPFNPLYVMAQSGARGNPQQIRQLCGMRGLMQKPSGETFEVPVRSSFREGLTVLEYFISSHGARKGGADTALRTADSGYLTRKLVDVAHEIVVREADCGTTNYISVPLFQPDEVTRKERLRKRSDIESGLYGRVLGPGGGGPGPQAGGGALPLPRGRPLPHQGGGGGGGAGGSREEPPHLPDPLRGLPEVLRLRPVHGPARVHRGGRGRGGRRVHRRARHPAHHAHLPHRGRGHGHRHHPGSSPGH